MERKYVKDAQEALKRLGCTGILALRIGKDFHISAYRPDQLHVYLHTIADVEQLILELARERVGAPRA